MEDIIQDNISERKSLKPRYYRLHPERNDFVVVDGLTSLPVPGGRVQLGYTLLCFCRRGYAEFVVNGVKHRLNEQNLLVNCGDAMVTDITLSEGFEAMAIVVSQDFMQESIMSRQCLWPFLSYLVAHPVLELGEDEIRRLRLNFRLILERLSLPQHSFCHEATIANFQACYLDVCDFLQTRVANTLNLQSRAYGIFDQFMHIVAKEYVEHRDVQWYANQMQLSSKHLSEVVKEVSGRPASTWITCFVVNEIKSLLLNTDLSIKEIATELHFANASFLGKFFKNVVGVSPMDFRINH